MEQFSRDLPEKDHLRVYKCCIGNLEVLIFDLRCIRLSFWIWPAVDPGDFRNVTPALGMTLVSYIYLRAVLTAQWRRLHRWGSWRLLSSCRLACGSLAVEKVIQAGCSQISSDCPYSAHHRAPTTTSPRNLNSLLSVSSAAPWISSFSWRVDNMISKDLSCIKASEWLLTNCKH